MTVVIDGTNGISGVNGSASSPAFEGADADSGIFINAANEVNASLNSTPVWSAVSTFGFKNRIINGAMVIDQRNNGSSITPANTYTLDRWQGVNTQASKFTVQQNAGSVTPPVGFTNYLGVTSSSAYAVLTGDTFYVVQYVEGYNSADLAWGSASAATITISFWVRSSLTGTFGGALANSAGNRSYPFSYTISSANTWEQKTVTIAGDTTGTWLTTNGTGIQVRFGLGSGATFTGTAGAWAAGNFVQPTGSVSVVGTNGATFYITGVQLEKGSTATSFDYRPYTTELQLCQRYYQTANYRAAFYGATGNAINQTISHLVVMRATPTAAVITAPTYTNGSAFAWVPITDGYSYAGATVSATGATVVTGAVVSLSVEL